MLPLETVTEREAAIRTLVAQDRAVTIVGERLSVAARHLCPAKGWATGLVVQTATQYGRDYRAAAGHVLGLGVYPTVTVVVASSAAERAGLLPGDAIVAIDGQPTDHVAQGAAKATVTDTTRALDAMDVGLRDGLADLTVVRSGARMTMRLAATPACRVRFEVRAGNDTNASATAARVQVSSDLIDPDRIDTDLAPLMAHEFAHVVLRHEQMLAGHWGGLLPGRGRGGAALRASEIAADRLGVYLLALAGYRPQDAIAFWTQFGRKTDYGVLSDGTHPGWQQRVAAIRQEVAEVERQRQAGEPIDPPADLATTVSE